MALHFSVNLRYKIVHTHLVSERVSHLKREKAKYNKTLELVLWTSSGKNGLFMYHLSL